MEHHTTTSRAEAERLLGIAEKLLRNKDYSGCKDFALLAQETEPLLEGSDQILAVAEVLLASTRKINNHQDWYSILQIGNRTDDAEQIKKQYRRFALLLHPDKNKYMYADAAFGLVADAWAVLSDPTKKSLYDNEMSLYTKVDLVPTKKPAAKRQPPTAAAARRSEDQGQKLPVRRSSRVSGNNSNNNENSNSNSGNENSNFNNSGGNNQSGGGRNTNPRSGIGGGVKTQRATFWSVCPYCYNLYEYERTYLGCCLRCENCERAFTAAEIRQMPPRVPGKNAYYCCWGFFPMGFVIGNTDGKRSISNSANAASGFPNWMPPMFPGGGGGGGGAPPAAAPAAAVAPTAPANGEGFVPVAEGNVGGTNVTVMGIAAGGAAPAAPKPKPKPSPQPVSGGPRKRGRPRKNPL
nr:DnaJ -like protein subfamily B member 5 [Ipomoea batatas]